MNHLPVQSTPAETRDELLRVSGRGYTKVRHLFTQATDGHVSRPGHLGALVKERKRRSLQLYLLLLTVWPWLKKEDPLGAAVWARALSSDTGRKWSTTNVSEAWSDLEQRNLIERQRLSRALLVTPRREDGAVEYTEPGLIKGNRHETYFTLPPEFWTDEWFEKLSMPALAMLLVVASRTSRADQTETWLTNEDAGDWYGLSPRSVEAGLSELEDKKLLSHRAEWVKAPLSKVGATKRHWYSLTGSFSTQARLEMQGAAQVERRKRLGELPAKSKKKSKKKPGKKARGVTDQTVSSSSESRAAPGSSGTRVRKSKSPGTP